MQCIKKLTDNQQRGNTGIIMNILQSLCHDIRPVILEHDGIVSVQPQHLFNQGKMDRAVVSGKAQSTYFYVKKDRSVAGKNEAAGDTINILFDAQKNAVKSLKLLGRSTLATGRYIDMEKEQRNKKKAETDSTKTTPRETVKEAPKGSAQEKLMNEDSKRGKLFRQAIEAKKAEKQSRKQPKKEDAK